jgi:hypothetical protein
MNNSTSTSQLANGTAVNRLTPISLLNLINNIYMLPIGSVIGFILNIPCLIVLFHRKLKGDTYKYLIFKTLSHLGFLFIIAIGPVFRCTTCPISLSLFANVVRYYLNLCTLNPLSTYAALVKIAVSYDRLLMLKQQKSKYLIKLPFWPTCICLILFSFIANLPFMLASRIGPLEGTNIWLFFRTDFLNTQFYQVYVFSYTISQNLLSLIMIVVLNILVKIEFGKYIEKKKKLMVSKQAIQMSSKTNKNQTSSLANIKSYSVSLNTLQPANLKVAKKKAGANREKSKDQNESAELNFTLMILLSSTLFSVTRFIQFMNVTYTMIYSLIGTSSPVIPYLSFSAFMATIIYYASNIFTYILFNKSFKA